MRDHEGLTFPLSEYERRLDELRQRMRRRKLHIMMVTDPENLTYLTGYQTTGYSYFQALIVPLEGEPFMVTRLLEESNVAPRTWVEKTWPYGDAGDAIQTVWHALKESDLANRIIGYEKNSYFFPAYQQERTLATLFDNQLYDCSGIVEESRITKSELEIEAMRRAALATEAGMKAGIEAVRPGVTENDLAAEIAHAMFRAGGEYPAVMPYVTSGPRTLIGHGTWEGRRIEEGDCVFLELGGCYRRYHTAMMRTILLGEPSDEMRDAEALVTEAIDQMKETMQPGRTAAEVDAAARAVLSRHAGRGALVTRSGYSIGIAFAPSWDEGYILSLKPGDTTLLKENMTFHIIPWLYGVDGDKVMGLSDTVRVTPEGGESFFPAMTPSLVLKN
jgi:Xaa-Pro dipeptidase